MSAMDDVPGAHPTPELLAELAAPESTDKARMQVASHLSQCERCLAIYAEFVHAQLRQRVDPEVITPSHELVELGKSVAAAAESRVRAPRRWAARSRIALALAVPALAALAALVMWRGAQHDAAAGLSMELRQAVASQARQDARGGLLYSEDLMPTGSTVRGPATSESSDLDLAQIVKVYNAGNPTSDVAYWLVTGYLATNQIRNADPYLREALQRFANDPRFHRLAAILAYKQDNLAVAETELRAALALERSSDSLVDLAIVCRQKGAARESAQLLAEAQARAERPEMAAYARQLSEQPAP